MSMWNLKSDHCFTHFFTRKSFFNSTGYFFGKNVHCSQIFITQIKDIINFLFRNNQSMSLHQRIDIKESKKLFVFSYLIAWNFTRYDSTEYCCHNPNI